MIWLLRGPHEDINHFWAIKSDTWTWDISTLLREIIFNLKCHKASNNLGDSVKDTYILATFHIWNCVFSAFPWLWWKEKHAALKNVLLQWHTSVSPQGLSPAKWRGLGAASDLSLALSCPIFFWPHNARLSIFSAVHFIPIDLRWTMMNVLPAGTLSRARWDREARICHIPHCNLCKIA